MKKIFSAYFLREDDIWSFCDLFREDNIWSFHGNNLIIRRFCFSLDTKHKKILKKKIIYFKRRKQSKLVNNKIKKIVWLRQIFVAELPFAGGIRTVSIAWIIPLVQITLAIITVASFTLRLFPDLVTLIELPSNIWTEAGKVMELICADVKLRPLITWYVKIADNFSLFSGLTKSATVPGGNLANAVSVGANTVNGPLPLNVVTRSAAVNAATRVLKLPSLIAVWTMSRFCAKLTNY